MNYYCIQDDCANMEPCSKHNVSYFLLFHIAKEMLISTNSFICEECNFEPCEQHDNTYAKLYNTCIQLVNKQLFICEDCKLIRKGEPSCNGCARKCCFWCCFTCDGCKYRFCKACKYGCFGCKKTFYCKYCEKQSKCICH